MVGFSAVGSLREEVKPRDFCVGGGVVDWTKGVREFFSLFVLCSGWQNGEKGGRRGMERKRLRVEADEWYRFAHGRSLKRGW